MTQDCKLANKILGQPLDLPCGTQLKNRLIKSAMSDSLGDGKGNATEVQARLYERWAEGGAALSIVGEAQITPHYPERPGNLVLVPESDLKALSVLAARGSGNNAHIWPQLGHAGALSYALVSNPKGPSPLNVDGLHCEGMTLSDLQELPEAYARAASVAKQAGFGGVQIHAGHGFLFSQFLSPLFNHRTDAYGGTIARRFRIIGETVDAVREAVGDAFPIGIRINATDKLVGGLKEEDAIEVVRLLNDTSIDLIDVSGGTYFPGAPSSSDGTSSSGPYFLRFAKRAKAMSSIPIMVTGGFKHRTEALLAIQSGAADAIGLARAMALDPDLPNVWLSNEGGDPEFPTFDETLPGGITAWYSMRLSALGEDCEDKFDQGLTVALDTYEGRDVERSVSWLKQFRNL